MRGVSRLGDWPGHVVLGLTLLVLAYWRRSNKWMRIFAAMILACALAGAAARVIKISTGRARPNVQTEAEWNGPKLSPRYSAFPSGHTAASTAFFATLALASWRIGLGFLVIPILIAFSRMYVAAHYLSDVVCASLIGLLAAYFVVHWDPARNPKSDPPQADRNPKLNGGGGGIRTHEGLRPAGFQDRSHQPLDHPSEI
jgi:membrane-associated phospholipid phosphatase